MEEGSGDYDVVILGTGLTECIVGAMLSVKGKRVLQIEQNECLGGDAANPLFKQMLDRHGGRAGVDLLPKYILKSGKLSTLLVKSKCFDTIPFHHVSSCQVYVRDRGIHSVPTSSSQVWASLLFAPSERAGIAKFYDYLHSVRSNNPHSWQNLDLARMTALQLLEHFDVGANGQDVIGHGLGLFENDKHLAMPAIDFVYKLRLYVESINETGKAPIAYLQGGLGELCKGLARLSGLYSSICMPNTKIKDILYDQQGHVSAVKMKDDDLVNCSAIVMGPMYDRRRSQVIGKLIQVMGVVKSVGDRSESGPRAVIFPARQLKRRSDVDVLVVPGKLHACHEHVDIVLVNGIQESSSDELEPIVNLFGPFLEKCTSIVEILEPLRSKDRIHVTSGNGDLLTLERQAEEAVNLANLLARQ